MADCARIEKELRKVFDEQDMDHNGLLDQHEMSNLIEHLHTNLGKSWITKYSDKIKEQVAKTMKQFDGDGDGCLDFNEFVAMVSTGKPWSTLLKSSLEGPEFDALKAKYESWKQTQPADKVHAADPHATGFVPQHHVYQQQNSGDLSRALEAHAALVRESYGRADPTSVVERQGGVGPYVEGSFAPRGMYHHPGFMDGSTRMYGSQAATTTAVSRATDPNSHLIAARSSAADLGYRFGMPHSLPPAHARARNEQIPPPFVNAPHGFHHAHHGFHPAGGFPHHPGFGPAEMGGFRHRWEGSGRYY